MYDSADSIYQIMSSISLEAKDMVMYGESLLQRGKVLTERQRDRGKKEDYKKADSLFQWVYVLAKDLPEDGWLLRRSMLYLTELSIWRGDKVNALRYARKNLTLQKDSSSIASAYYFMGKSLYLNKETDSASVYLHRALAVSESSYATKINSYGLLGEMAHERGDLKKALEMEQSRASYAAQLQSGLQPNALKEAVKNEKLEQKRQEIALELSVYKVVIAGMGMLVIGLVVYKYRNRLFYRKKPNQDLQVRIDALQEMLEESGVYLKMQDIIREHQAKGCSSKFLPAAEWESFIQTVDQCFPGIIALWEKHRLDRGEIRLCCLYLVKMSITGYACLMACTRDSIYKKNRKIQKKMGIQKQKVPFQYTLKSWIETEMSKGNIRALK